MISFVFLGDEFISLRSTNDSYLTHSYVLSNSVMIFNYFYISKNRNQ